jgi:peptidoglycan hydrolase-like protein with peptidoglycan-binding domain
VEELQRALAVQGVENAADGIYGPFTDSLVQSWQARHGLKEDGVGPETRKSLGLS